MCKVNSLWPNPLILFLFIGLSLNSLIGSASAFSPVMGESYLSKTFSFESVTGNIELSWWHWHQVFAPYDNARVLVNDQEVWRITDNLPTDNWSRQTIDLTAYAGQQQVTVRFAILATAEVNRMGWYMDDIGIASTSFNYFENFENGPGEWTATGPLNWQYGQITTATYKNCGFTAIPYPEPVGAYSGTKVWGTVLDGCYNNFSGPFLIYMPLLIHNYSGNN
jgi:hypothetical protein